MRLGTSTFAVAAVALLLTGTAHAAAPPLGADGETAPAYDYQQATRERVFIPQPGIDQDRNGADDKITIDIIRPAESGPALEVPAIVVPSPYLTTTCIGRRNDCMGDMDVDGVNDLWPLFLDNFFVPRGFAYVLAQMNGTGYTTDGCPHEGGAGDVAGEKSVIDWLNGRTAGVDKNGNPKVADWHNGSSAMIGKSYDGTLANGVAATGVDGLKTIVPIAAISDWYGYSRRDGIRVFGSNYPSSLNNTVTYSATSHPGISLPDRRPLCTAVNTDFNALDGDDTGDVNAFWNERNYAKDVGNVEAAVFAVHGFQDDNVPMSQLWPWWNGLKAAGVPRKLWLLRSGHTDPFESRRAVWVDTLHRWFDHWLYGVDNGIETDPPVTIEDAKDVWGDYADWPVPGTDDVDVFLRGTSQAEAGALRGSSGGPVDSVFFTNTAAVAGTTLAATVETGAMTAPTGSQANRRVFLSPPLAADLRLSGRAVVDLHAALSTTQSNLGAIVVDYGATPFDEVTRSNEGLANTQTQTCWGSNGTYDNACYLEVSKPTTSVTQWRVTRGILDSSNRSSLTTAQPAVLGQAYGFSIPTQPTEHTFKAGHQIGIVIVGNLFGIAGTPGAQITVDTKLSKVVLPIVGGDAAARASGLTDETAPVTSASVSAPVNAAGWVHVQPTVTLSAADDAGGSGIKEITYSTSGAETAAPQTVAGGAASVHVGAEGVTTLHVSATDRAGNTEPEQTLTVKVDTTAPTTTCAAADGRWHATDVAVACTAGDSGSGLAAGGAFTLRTAVPAGVEDPAAPAMRSVCDVAGNCTVAGARHKIDRRPPTVTLTTPRAVAFARGEVVAARYACSDGGSGVASCTGLARLDTATAGAHQLAVTARDAVGNSRTARWTYSVLGRAPKLRVKRKPSKIFKDGLRVALTSRLRASVRITGVVGAAHGPRVRLRSARVKLEPGVTRVVTLKLPAGAARRFGNARRLTAALSLASAFGALRRTDPATFRFRS
jgi:X-Pro dipeptidyl-peptidase